MENCHVLKNIYTQQIIQDDTTKVVGALNRHNHEDDDDEQDRDPCYQYVNPTDVVHSIFDNKVSIKFKRECKLLKRACLNVDSAGDFVSNPKLPA